MKFQRKCSCVRTYTDKKYRLVNVVFKEGATAPIINVNSFEFANRECPHCHGDGWIEEECSNEAAEVEALMRDFKKKMAVIL